MVIVFLKCISLVTVWFLCPSTTRALLLRHSDVLQPLVYNGKPVTSTDFAYQVSMENKKNKRHYCGGAIINEQFVLTAAHCVQKDKEKIQIRSNTFIKGHGGQVRDVAEMVSHELYNAKTMDNDIALVKISPPYYQFHEHFQPVELPINMGSLVGQRGTVSGWGLTETGERPTKLLSVDVPILSPARCMEGLNVFKMGNILTNNMMCAGYDNEQNACRGDSGGPFVIDHKIVGVVSWTPDIHGKLQCDSIAMYANVANYLDWITKKQEEMNGATAGLTPLSMGSDPVYVPPPEMEYAPPSPVVDNLGGNLPHPLGLPSNVINKEDAYIGGNSPMSPMSPISNDLALYQDRPLREPYGSDNLNYDFQAQGGMDPGMDRYKDFYPDLNSFGRPNAGPKRPPNDFSYPVATNGQWLDYARAGNKVQRNAGGMRGLHRTPLRANHYPGKPVDYFSPSRGSNSHIQRDFTRPNIPNYGYDVSPWGGTSGQYPRGRQASIPPHPLQANLRQQSYSHLQPRPSGYNNNMQPPFTNQLRDISQTPVPAQDFSYPSGPVMRQLGTAYPRPVGLEPVIKQLGGGYRNPTGWEPVLRSLGTAYLMPVGMRPVMHEVGGGYPTPVRLKPVSNDLGSRYPPKPVIRQMGSGFLAPDVLYPAQQLQEPNIRHLSGYSSGCYRPCHSLRVVSLEDFGRYQ